MSCKRIIYTLIASCSLLATGGQNLEAAGLLIADGGFGGVLEIKEHDVKVTVNNGVAVTEIRQTFVNTEQRIVEALYTFPVPKNASVSNFSMWINGREMTGEVVEKKRAREIYESYKQTRRDPGLLEQVDYKSFELRIFPIAPGAEQRILVTYYQELEVDHDWATYVYPLATVTRKEIDQKVSGKFAMDFDVKSQVPIAEMQSPSHGEAFVVASHSEQYFQASMEANEGQLDRDLVINYRLARPRTGADLITSRTDGEDGYFLITVTAGEELEKLDVGMDYVFVLDISGSMARDGKLTMSTESVAAFVDALGPKDRFEIVSVNIGMKRLFGALSDVSDERLQQAHTFLDQQRAAGGTVIHPALDKAYEYKDDDRILNVVVLSDGMTKRDEANQMIEAIRKRPSNARVFCIGIGNEVNRPLLNEVATKAEGLAAFISQGDDFERQAKAFRRKLLRPAVSNCRISFNGSNVYNIEPKEIPNLFHGSPIRIYGRYKKPGPVEVTMSGDVQGRSLEKTIQMDMPVEDHTNPEIERMWAWHGVQRLLSERHTQALSQGTIDKIVELCEGYSIVSEYASFIVLENDAEYERWQIKRRNAIRIERDRDARRALREELTRIKERGDTRLTNALESNEAASSTNSITPTASPKQQPARTTTPTRSPQRSWDIGVNSGSRGGGAIDPVTGVLMLLTVAGGAVGAMRRRGQRD